MEKATFAAGCFWGVEAAFRKQKGVQSTAVGYIGGTVSQPTYKDVCTGQTGHAEAVEIDFDPAQVSYSELLHLFWSIHNPTTKNRQGPDYGTQYRSGVFFHSPEQETRAKASLAEAQSQFPARIVTEITPASTFWRVEEYHQQYIEKGGHSACHI
jgi:peptide-methionine (S)-S-oxide reductase